MTIEEMIDIKNAGGYSYQAISDYSDVPVATIYKIFQGISKSPRKATMEALERGFARLEGMSSVKPGEGYSYDTSGARSAGGVREVAARYGEDLSGNAGDHYGDDDIQSLNSLFITRPDGTHIWLKQGYYTSEDRDRLPANIRVELVDGVFYELYSPNMRHQTTVGFIHAALLDYIRKSGQLCRPFMAPLDVYPYGDDKTILQPDIFVVCDHEKLTTLGVKGAPDFVIEVLSESTRRRDMTQKAYIYAQAGVKLYWLIDLKKEAVIVHNFTQGDDLGMYPFNGSVPVEIEGCDLVIDFRELLEDLKTLP